MEGEVAGSRHTRCVCYLPIKKKKKKWTIYVNKGEGDKEKANYICNWIVLLKETVKYKAETCY